MKMRPGWLLSASLALAILAGCGQHSTGSAAETDPPSPAVTANDNAWGSYLAEQGKIHGKETSPHPFIFLVPEGDSTEALTRRKDLARYVSSSIGPVILPGSTLIFGGRSAAETNAFAQVVGASTKKDALKGSIVLIVSDGEQKELIGKSFDASQATLRFSKMQQK
jgi:hypothetical protein